jgi:predicted phage tail protein
MNSDGTTRIYLGGKLGQIFGKEWNLCVNSPAEAIRAIDVNTKGKLKDYLYKQGTGKFYKIAIRDKKNILTKAELKNRSGHQDIFILPTARGRSSGLGKILAAIALIVAVVYLGPLVGIEAVAAGAEGNLGSALYSALISSAVALGVGGVVQLLTPIPNFNQDNSATKGSNLFQGNATAIAQGGAVGIVYGRALVAPMPVSIATENFDQSTYATGGNGGSVGPPESTGFNYGNYNILSNNIGYWEYIPQDPTRTIGPG